MEPSVKTSITAMQVIYSSLMVGVFLFLIVSVVLNQISGPLMPEKKELQQILLIASALLAVSSIAAGIAIARKQLLNLQVIISNTERLDRYRSVLIIRAALMEGPAFFFIVCNLLFANLAFSIGAILCLAVMAFYYPTKSRIGNETGINMEL